MKPVLVKILFWFWFVMVALFSLLPGGIFRDMRIIITTSGFWEHLLAYAVLAFLAAWAYAGRKAGLVLLFVFVISIGFEYLQLSFLNRTFNPMDIVANGTGLGVGFCCRKALSVKF